MGESCQRVLDASATPASGTLNQAAIQGDVHLVESLLRESADVNGYGENGRTPLMEAASRKYPDVVKILLRAGANTELRSTSLDTSKWASGCTALEMAVIAGDAETVRALVAAHTNVNSRDKSGRTALHRVAVNPVDDVLRVLLLNGSNVDVRDSLGATPLHLATSADIYSWKSATVLLAAGANANAQDLRGDTPLHHAIRFQRPPSSPSLVGVLLDAGANVSLVNDAGMTPLHIAAENRNKEVMQMLLARNADAFVQTASGMTALHYAVGQFNNGPVVRVLVNFMVAGGLETRDAGGMTALHKAVISGDCDSVKALLNGGADIDARTNRGLTAIHLAAQCPIQSIFELLLNATSNVRAIDSDGWTALHFAAASDTSGERVKRLVESGWDIEAQVTRGSQKGWKPLHLALWEGWERSISYLLFKGHVPITRDDRLILEDQPHQSNRFSNLLIYLCLVKLYPEDNILRTCLGKFYLRNFDLSSAVSTFDAVVSLSNRRRIHQIEEIVHKDIRCHGCHNEIRGYAYVWQDYSEMSPTCGNCVDSPTELTYSLRIPSDTWIAAHLRPSNEMVQSEVSCC
jgi:ankyrin repeat protein